jgi:HTH-type transcriptional regulator, sugar sensing transcriptional regulator
MIEAILCQIGLSENEAKVYLALLEMHKSSASVLSSRLKIHRNVARYTCQHLAKRGVVKEKHEGNSFVYYPEPPEKLSYLLKEEEQKLQEKKEQLNRVLGTLKGIVDPNTALPKVRFFEGKKGIINLYEEILNIDSSPIESFEDGGEMYNFFPEYVPDFINKRVKKGIVSKTISPTGNKINQNKKTELREIKEIPKEAFPFSCDIKICKDVVSIFSFEKDVPVGIMVKHQDIADNFRILFNYIWTTLPDSFSPEI